MSVIDQINKLFQGKPGGQKGDEQSRALGDQNTTAVLESAGSVTVADDVDSQNAFAQSRLLTDDQELPAVDDALRLPFLGSRSIAAQQRILYVLLAAALTVLAVVTFTALSQADRVAQQVAATGQSLMQSQRLAKSVSQALVGSAQAFPDVKESAASFQSGCSSSKFKPMASRVRAAMRRIWITVR